MLQQELESAEKILARFNRLSETIATGVEGLGPLIEGRLAAEHALSAAQVQEATEGGTEAEQGVLDGELALRDAHHALDEAGRRLGALRGAQAALGGQLAEQHQALAQEIPASDAALVQAFSREWDAAIAAFGFILARRRAVERLIGMELKLPLPAPTPTHDLPSDPIGDLSQFAQPRRILDSLKQCLAELKRAGDLRRYVPVNPIGWQSKPYDSSAVYRLIKPCGTLPPGTLVVSASFTPGELHSLVEGDTASLYVDPESMAGTNAARTALLKIKADEAEAARVRAAQQQQDAPAYRLASGPDKWYVKPAPQPGSDVHDYIDAKTGRRVHPGSGGVH